MAETKKTEAAAAAAPPEAACLTLRQKLVEMRKACPEIVKKQHSDGVSYKYAKIYDVWEKITPIMNELGVDFDVISEQATRHAENGDPVYWITMQTKTRNGDKLMFLYEADLTIRWLNLDNDDETIEATVHAVGWNDDPAKAKGAAHTYALKYYLFEKFTVDQGEDDPDNSDFGAQGKGSGAGGRQQATQGRQGQSSGRLSDAQLTRLYKKAEAAGMTKERTNARIVEKYKKQDPATLTRQEYDEICTSLDNAAAQHNQQGGNAYRELGLYAEDPDPEVGEVLYCYGNCGDLAEWIPPSGGATIVEKTIDIVTAIGTATNVTAYIPADAYATKEDYETYKAIALGAQATAEEALALARQAIAIAQAAEASVNDLSNAVGQNTSKIATLWDAVFSEITTNPFQITFADLTGITLTAGIWNSGLQRLEC